MPLTALKPQSCNIGGLRKIGQENKDGAVVIFTLDSCHACDPIKKAVDEVVGGRMPIIQVRGEESACDPLLNKLKVNDLPSVGFTKGGKIRWISRGDRTEDEIRKSVAKLVPKKGKKA
jgi:hypothetical protein